MFETIKRDMKVIFERDPAARGVFEIIFCYPGFHAILSHRIANWFWRHKFYFTGRFISHISRFFTGIEIHPGATIGSGFFIDHGMGVVIGETAEIGDNVTMYHGVTLGGTSWKKEKRHPTIQDNVIIGAGAKILGPFAVGSNSKIGSNSVVVKEVPPHSTVVGIPGRVVFREGANVYEDSPIDKVDPEAKAISCLFDQIREMEKKIKLLEEKNKELEDKVNSTGKESETYTHLEAKTRS